jgi:flotillin
MSVGPVGVLAFAVVLFIFICLILIGLYFWRYKKVPPGKVMLIYGKGIAPGREFAIVKGGGKFIIPVVQSYSLLSLEVRTITAELKDGVTSTKNGDIVVDVAYTTQYRIGDSEKAISKAAPLFLNAKDEDMEFTVRSEVENALKEVLFKYDLERITPLLDRYASLVRERAQRDLDESGMEIRNLVIKDIRPRP